MKAREAAAGLTLPRFNSEQLQRADLAGRITTMLASVGTGGTLAEPVPAR